MGTWESQTGHGETKTGPLGGLDEAWGWVWPPGYDKVSKHASIACRQRTNFVGRRGWKKGRTITKEIQIKERTKEIEDKLLTGCTYKIF